MSIMAMIYLLGMALIFVGERLLAGHEVWRAVVTVAGFLGLGVAAGLEIRKLKSVSDPGIRLGRRWLLASMLTAFVGLVLYLGTTDAVIDGLGLRGESKRHWAGIWGSLWPIVWLLGTVPLLVIDHVLWRSPVVVPVRQVRHGLLGGVSVALVIALVFPINFIASQNNERWDLTYFKTTAAGTATRNIVASLQQPVTVRIFLPPASELSDELRGYFDALEGPNLQVDVLDQAAHPRLAKALRVRGNGVIAITRGEVSLEEDDKRAAEGARPLTKTIDVGTDLDKAKRKLRKLDQEVQTALLELGHGDRVAYVTAGHGELSWDGQGKPDTRIVGLKQVLEALQFRVETLSLAEGLGDAVPEDADVVLVLGPRQPFDAAEVQALQRYVETGGSLLLALEPDVLEGAGGLEQEEDPLAKLMEFMGVKPGDGILAAEAGYYTFWHAKRDRTNLVTNRFSVHPVTKMLSENASRLLLLVSGAGFLSQVEDTTHKVLFIVRSLPMAWADLDGNLELDADAGEEKRERPLAAAVTGGSGEDGFRALVVADSTVFSDLALRNLANQQFAVDGLNWLIGAEALSGTTESEEDVRIEHTKEGQTAWFYSTILGVPLMVLLLGFVRMRFRRRGDD